MSIGSRTFQRRLIGAAVLVALVAIGLSAIGVEIRAPAREAPLPGVRARSTRVIARPPGGAQPGQVGFLAVDPNGNLLVTNRDRRSVLRYDPTGRLLGEWGPQLGPDVSVEEPAGVAADTGHVYLLDRGRARLFQLDVAGRLESTVSLEDLGTYGLNGLAVDSKGTVFAADTGRNRLLLFGGGRLLRELGGSGKGLGQFTQPMALAFGPDGGFFVADWENGRVERFQPDYAPVSAWETGFRPWGVAVDPLGRVYVPDAEARRVEVYAPGSGALLGEVGTPGTLPLDVQEPKEAAFGPGGAPLYVLGIDGVARVEWEDTAPPPQSVAGDFLDPETIAVAAGVLVLALLVLARQRRRAALAARGAESLQPVVRAAPQETGLNPENRTEREEQEAETYHDPVPADHAERNQQPGDEHDQAEENPQTDHQR